MKYAVIAASGNTIKAKSEPRLCFNSENFSDIVSSIDLSKISGGLINNYDKSQVDKK
jgi:hypothetical protein